VETVKGGELSGRGDSMSAEVMKQKVHLGLLLRIGVLVVVGLTLFGAAPASSVTRSWLAPTAARQSPAPTAYITNYQSGTISVLHGAKIVGTISGVGPGPTGIALVPGTSNAYVADFGYLNSPGDTVTPVDLATGTTGSPITVGSGPFAIRITPDGLYAVVNLLGVGAPKGDQIVRITLATGAVSKPVKVGSGPESLVISPDGSTAYVGSYGTSTANAVITPVEIETPTPKALPKIPIPGTAPSALVIAPDGQTLYVTDAAGAQLIPISIPSDTVGQGLGLICTKQGDPGCSPEGLAITPKGATAWITAAGSGDVLKVNLEQFAVVHVSATGGYPDGVGVTDGWAYTANAASNDVTVIHDGSVVATPSVGEYPLGVVVVG
jgi:DNA-binding beta-propeller fold protein YncE